LTIRLFINDWSDGHVFTFCLEIEHHAYLAKCITLDKDVKVLLQHGFYWHTCIYLLQTHYNNLLLITFEWQLILIIKSISTTSIFFIYSACSLYILFLHQKKIISWKSNKIKSWLYANSNNFLLHVKQFLKIWNFVFTSQVTNNTLNAKQNKKLINLMFSDSLAKFLFIYIPFNKKDQKARQVFWFSYILQ